MTSRLSLGGSLCLFISLIGSPLSPEARASDTAEEALSFWIEVTDQNGEAITGADVFYCHSDCSLDRNAGNRKTTTTNAAGKARITLGPNDTTRLQGIHKPGYDIRLSTYPDGTIRLNREGHKKLDFFHPQGGIRFEFEPDTTPFNAPESSAVLKLQGWKLGETACIEQNHDWIRHDGRAEANWTIDDQRHYYRFGDEQHSLRKGSPEDHDFSITINRKYYPWGNLLYRFASYYQAELVFANGGAQRMLPADYPHQVPRDDYQRILAFSYRGIGEVAKTHVHKLYIKSNERHGILQLALTPSQEIFFEYLLNRSPDSTALNIPSTIFAYGVPNNYFSCHATASSFKPHVCPPGVCAALPSQRRSC